MDSESSDESAADASAGDDGSSGGVDYVATEASGEY